MAKVGKKKSTKRSSEGFYITFVGEYVQLIGEFSSQTVDGTYATISGYLLDLDDDYFYIGPTADEINAAIKKDNVFSIQIMPKKDKYSDLLDDVPRPKNKDAGN
jgi:hypothetical protein